MDIITAHNIRKHFGTLQVLRGIDLAIANGEVVAIVGASGAGKTTLLQILGTLDTPDQGQVIINGTDISTLKSDELAHFRNRNIGFVFQFHQLLPEFTALENVMLPALLGGTARHQALEQAQTLLSRMGLQQRANHKPSALSGGEKQRVAVARAMINNPAVIFADEPSGSLDSEGKRQLHQLLFRLRQETGVTLVIVTHDETLAAAADRTLRIADGLITPQN